ncbi:MAG: cytochrome c oxidase accessory protein CcoG, partial [Burkholderiales bacterium]|nr:cytochrome c oxidase accessory protein CcoG [Burkholderiales bacterium]
LYEVSAKIYPRAVHGRFAAWRWALVWATQLAFYGGPWLQWNGRQAVLFDIAERKFFIFGLVFWPQDIIYLTVLLIVSALSLFLFTAVAGRLWCGYACPQTVYTEVFLWIERVIEGDRNARMRLDKSGFSTQKFVLKSGKHAAWIAVAFWTGFTFVGYFTPIREMLSFNWGAWEGFWVAFYGFATYGNAGWMREQVCKYMCPYARFQSAMFDKDTLIITYDEKRGEPRGKGAASGDCVDCGICVQACPTGIDIRNGLQYECIGCAACIDGCNQVMDKLARPRGLIRYSKGRVLRPRVIVYAAILGAIALAAAASLWLRVPLKVDVIRDRAAIAREVEGGLIENVFRLQVMNTEEQPRAYEVKVAGLPGIHVWGEATIGVPAATSRMVPVRVRVEPGAAPGSHPIEFTITALGADNISVHEDAVFFVR